MPAKMKGKKINVRIAAPKKARQNARRAPQPLVISHETLFPRGSFARAGGAIGSMFGPKGMVMGRAAGEAISRITGVGDYTVKANTITTETATLSGEVPSFGKTDNSTRVRHREFVTDITASSTPNLFDNSSYVIQPGNAALFPWLSSLAQNYQQYRVHGMVFMFKSTTSDYSSAGALGKIALATNYNVRDSAFVNMQELENAEFSVSGKPSLSRIHPIECAAANGVPLVKWVRDTQYDASGGDDRLYDVGKFQVATQGLPASTAGAIIGELWVTYDIEFFKPIVSRAATGEAYEPVAVPVFDTYAGTNGAGPTQSLTMMETTAISKPTSGWTSKADLLSYLRNPGMYTRSTTESGRTRLCRSAYRSVPDPIDDPTGSYPAYWGSTDTLTLQRKGIYQLRLAAVQAGGLSINRNTAGGNNWIETQPLVVPSTATSAQKFAMGQIIVTGLEDSYEIIMSACPGSVHMQPQPSNTFSTSGDSQTAVLYTSDMSWDLKIWVKADYPSGSGVTVNFLDPVGVSADRDNDIGLTWATVNSVDISTIVDLRFDVSFVAVSPATYYLPVNSGITRDDSKRLQESVASIEAMLPKLRALGLV